MQASGVAPKKVPKKARVVIGDFDSCFDVLSGFLARASEDNYFKFMETTTAGKTFGYGAINEYYRDFIQFFGIAKDPVDARSSDFFQKSILMIGSDRQNADLEARNQHQATATFTTFAKDHGGLAHDSVRTLTSGTCIDTYRELAPTLGYTFDDKRFPEASIGQQDKINLLKAQIKYILEQHADMDEIHVGFADDFIKSALEASIPHLKTAVAQVLLESNFKGKFVFEAIKMNTPALAQARALGDNRRPTDIGCVKTVASFDSSVDSVFLYSISLMLALLNEAATTLSLLAPPGSTPSASASALSAFAGFLSDENNQRHAKASKFLKKAFKDFLFKMGDLPSSGNGGELNAIEEFKLALDARCAKGIWSSTGKIYLESMSQLSSALESIIVSAQASAGGVTPAGGSAAAFAVHALAGSGATRASSAAADAYA